MSRRKFDDLRAIEETGCVLIVRLPDGEDALEVARAAIDGGIRAIEITYSVPGALDIVRTLADENRGRDVLVGVGTVLDEHAAYAAILAGARMLVSPNLDPGMLRLADRYQAVTVGGAFTATEVVGSLEAGADYVKIFPAELGGPDYARTLLAPLPQAPLVPAGGVTVANAADWFAAGVAAVAVGSSITKAAAGTGDYRAVTAAAEDMLAAIAHARSAGV